MPASAQALLVEGTELRGWKQIACYLDVTERTAQVWEHQRGLPIHRLPGAKGRAFTTKAEIESWKRCRTSSGPGQPARRAITVRLSQGHYDRLKACSADRRLTVQELAARAVVEYLNFAGGGEYPNYRASVESRNSGVFERPGSGL